MKQQAALDVARQLQLVDGERFDVMFHGLSMDPLLFEGDHVVVEAATAGDVQIGDIVVYCDRTEFPARRLVAVDPRRLTLWCDAWPDRIFHVAPNAVVGRAVARIRNGHRLEASSVEWRTRAERAMAVYRRQRPRFLVRRVGRGLRRRLPGRSV